MKIYELAYLISPEISESELKDFQEKINSLIQQEGGILNRTSSPTKKELAYPVKKKNEAFLTNLNFSLEPAKLESLEKKVRSEKKILRYLILTKPRTKKILVRTKKLPKKPIPKEKKVELKEIEKKLKEILDQ